MSKLRRWDWERNEAAGWAEERKGQAAWLRSFGAGPTGLSALLHYSHLLLGPPYNDIRFPASPSSRFTRFKT